MINKLATRTVTGIHTLTGKTLTYTVDAIEDTEKEVDRGRWMVLVNGRPTRWYGMEKPALRCVRKAIVGGYGLSFGEAF